MLNVPLDEVHDVNFALLRVICPPFATVTSNTAPLPLFLTILVNSVEKVDGETEREFIEGTFVAEETEMNGEERRVIPLKETPLRVRDPVEETERKDDWRAAEEVSQLNAICVIVVCDVMVKSGYVYPF